MHARLRFRRLLPLVATLLVAAGGPAAGTFASRAVAQAGTRASLGGPVGAPSDAKAVRSVPSSLLAGVLVGEGGASFGDGRVGATHAPPPSSVASATRARLSRGPHAPGSPRLLADRAVAGEADLPPPLS